MAYLGTKDLEELLPHCIDKFNKENIKSAAYELCLGDEVFVTNSKDEIKLILDEKNSQIVIKPGQFALLLTDEVITIPDDILAFISIKFSQKIKGLINVSGFHVDPGFNSKLIFSVFNAGLANIVLDKGSPYFLIWFSKLSTPCTPYKGKHRDQTSISGDMINNLNGELASPNVLLDRIKSNESSLTNLKMAAGIAITILIGIGFKTFSDSAKFNEGYIIGKKEKRIEQDVDSILNSSKIDTIIINRIENRLKEKK